MMEGCNPGNINGSNYSDVCQYVKNLNACYFESGFLNYFEWQYCGFDDRVAPTILLFLWFLVLIMGVATTADSFFAPCLVVVTRILKMSQNLAGVTLLALGNGAADVFSSLSAILSSNDPNVGLAFGSILGAGILVNTITAGIIMIICPFPVMRRPIIKDLIFYLLALSWVTVILIRRTIELWSSIVLLSIYIMYVFVTAISRAMYVKYRKSKRKDARNENIEVTVTNEIIFDNERNMQLSTQRLPKSSSTISHLDLGHTNPTYINDFIGGFLNVPRFDQCGGTILFRKSISPRTSVIDVTKPLNICPKKRMYNSLKLHRFPSTSHRSLGSFAQIIIKNEHEREIMKTSSKFQISKGSIRRTVSLNALSEINKPKIQIKFYSSEASNLSKGKENKLQRPSIYSLHNKPNNVIEQNLNGIVQFNPSDGPSCVKFPGIFKHFLLTILPIQLENLDEQSFCKKFLLLLQSPIVFILTLTIPVVEDGAYLKGWCKILNCLHCIFSPLIWVTFIHVNMNPIGNEGFVVTYLILIIGFLASISVAITSEADSPPIYQPFFAFMGFITSIFWIYGIVNEIVNVLTMFGIVFSIPQTILGFSILAFANSVGDLVSNITLARRNYCRIAYAACIGGPLFNLLVGIGLPFSIKTSRMPIRIKLKSETVMLIFTTLLITVMNLVALPILKFQVNKTYGILLLIIYIIFFLLIILLATDVINVTV